MDLADDTAGMVNSGCHRDGPTDWAESLFWIS